MYLTVGPLRGPGSIPSRDGVLQGIFPWLIALYQLTRPEPAWQKMVQSPLNGIIQPVEIEEEGRGPTTDRQRLKDRFNRIYT